MKIGIDISQIVYEGTGVARFTRGLVESVLKYDTENHWTFFLSSLRKQIPADLVHAIRDKQTAQLVQYPLPPRALSVLWNTLHILPVTALTGPLDWFISSDWAEPPANCRKATIVHDLVFKRYPNTVHPVIRRTQEKRLQWVQKESTIIFTDSNTTRADLTEYYDIEQSRVHTNYPGVTIPPLTQSPQQVLSDLAIQQPFMLAVGKQEPRKNLSTLIDAFVQLKQTHHVPDNLTLCIVGPSGWGKSQEKLHEHVRLLGFVPDQDLFALYPQAHCLVFPSMYEGFGYPAVEAMTCGCPVVMSNTSSLAEIGQDDSALLFDPSNSGDIQQALKTITSDESLRQNLIKNGKLRAHTFSWKQYYERMMSHLSV